MTVCHALWVWHNYRLKQSTNSNKKQTLDDLSLLTGATIVNEDLGDDMDLIQVEYLGSCLKSVTSHSETIIQVADTSNEVKEVIHNIKLQLQKDNPSHEVIKLEKRLAMLAAKIAVVKVGANSDIELKENKKINLTVPETHNSFIYLLKGDLKIGSKKHENINDSTLILLEKGSDLEVLANKKSKFLFIAGKPIGEPIARGGPFVMNTKAEILQAIQDYNNGTFAKY